MRAMRGVDGRHGDSFWCWHWRQLDEVSTRGNRVEAMSSCLFLSFRQIVPALEFIGVRKSPLGGPIVHLL